MEQVHLELLFAIRGEEPTDTGVTSEADDQIDVTAANVVTDIPGHSGSWLKGCGRKHCLSDVTACEGTTGRNRVIRAAKATLPRQVSFTRVLR